jgi:hypothetical protein
VKLTKAIVLPIASAALVVLGTGAVLAATAPSSPSTTGAIVPAAASSSPAPAASSKPVAPYLTSVLDGLVAKGTITATQEQAIVDAWVAKRGELKAERQQLRTFLSDGVLTAAELAQLPADSPLQALKPLMTNGQITVDQLRQLGRGILSDLRMGGMGANGAGMGGMRGLLNGNGATTPSASPATGG